MVGEGGKAPYSDLSQSVVERVRTGYMGHSLLKVPLNSLLQPKLKQEPNPCAFSRKAVPFKFIEHLLCTRFPYNVSGSLDFRCFCSLICPATRSQVLYSYRGILTLGKLRHCKVTRSPPKG